MREYLLERKPFNPTNDYPGVDTDSIQLLKDLAVAFEKEVSTVVPEAEDVSNPAPLFIQSNVIQSHSLNENQTVNCHQCKVTMS